MDARVPGDAVEHVEWYLRQQLGAHAFMMRRAMHRLRGNPANKRQRPMLRKSLMNIVAVCEHWQAMAVLPPHLKTMRDHAREALVVGVGNGSWTEEEVRSAW